MAKMTLTINKKAEEILDRLSKETGKSKSEIIRQGIILRDYLGEENENGGRFVVKHDGKVDKEVVLT